MVLIPILVLCVFEIGLRMAGVGEERRSFLRALNASETTVAVNPALGARYFNGFVPSVAFNPIDAEKGENTLRIVVLGGSSAAGFPYQFYYGFPEAMRRQLSSALPHHEVEVMNLGMTAVNSYTLWDLRDEVSDLNPDLVLIYAGHNEFYGAFGAGSAIYGLGGRPSLKRLILRLKTLAMVSAIESLAAPEAGDPNAQSGGDSDRTLMARVVRESSIPFEGEVYSRGVRQYRDNVGDVLDHFESKGIPVLMGTLVANLADQRPLGDSEVAREAYELGDSADCPDVACKKRAFQTARDLDDIRFRAPGAINDQILAFENRDGVHVVDLRPVFESASETGIPGYDLFVDHLHPTQPGYELMGASFAEGVIGILQLEASEDEWPTGAALDPLEKTHSDLLIQRLLADYPFVKNRSREDMTRISDALVQRYRSGGEMDSIAAALVSSPLTVSGGLAAAIGHRRGAPISEQDLRLYEALFYWQPFNGTLMKGVISDAMEITAFDSLTVRLAALAAHLQEDGFYWDAMGAVSLRRGKERAASRALNRAEAINPQSSTMLFNQARLHLQRGDTLTAQQYFERFQAVAQGQ